MEYLDLEGDLCLLEIPKQDLGNMTTLSITKQIAKEEKNKNKNENNDFDHEAEKYSQECGAYIFVESLVTHEINVAWLT